jgi:uncharacterized protein (DUF885 family)
MMASIILLKSGENVNATIVQKKTYVGHAAVEMVDAATTTVDDDETLSFQVSDALVSSVKRIVRMKPHQLQQNTKSVESLPFSVVYKMNSQGDQDVYISRFNHSIPRMMATIYYF